jgi:hypothetical protein
MNFDPQHIFESKRVHRQNLAALPVAEKLRMLDAMRERELAIRARGILVDANSSVVREDPSPFRKNQMTDREGES